MADHTHDLLIIGGGPAGLSAAIRAAAEGIDTALLESNERLGGQPKDSAEVANYPGFPGGIAGKELTEKMAQQAAEFDVEIIAPHYAIQLTRLAVPAQPYSPHVVLTADYEQIIAKTIVLANGLTYRKHSGKNISKYLGRGVHYGPLPTPLNGGDRTIAIIGGANSAGQAVLKYRNRRNVNVKLISRSPLEKGMSEYLIRRIKKMENVEIIEGVEVDTCDGNGRITTANLTDGRSIPIDAMLIYIGGMPQTKWLQGTINLDEKGFVLTGYQAGIGNNGQFSTSVPGIFAIGDVRAGSMKSIAAAVGEGSTVVPDIIKYLIACNGNGAH